MTGSEAARSEPPQYTVRWLRLVAAGLATALLIIGWVVGRLQLDSPTIAKGVICFGVTVASIALFMGACGPDRRLREAWLICARFLSRRERPLVALSPSANATIIALAILSYLILVTRALSVPDDPRRDDQGAYLEVAQEIRSSGGLTTLASDLFTGTFREANRHPLYIAVLSTVPDYRSGRWQAAVIGLITLIVLTVLIGKRYSWSVGGIFAVLLATNEMFLEGTTRTVCEGLMVLWGGLLWWWLGHEAWSGTATPDSAAGESLPSLRKSVRLAAVTGALCGLLWLTKGTGLLITVATIAALLIVHRRAPRRGFAVVMLLATTFLLVGSPLIVRNLQRFGEPFYNVNTFLLFTERFEDLEPLVESGRSSREIGMEYLSTASPGALVRRFVHGLVWEAFIGLRSLGPAYWGDARVLWVTAYLLVIPLGWGPPVTISQRATLLLWVGLCWPLFGWYVPIAAGGRFVAPLLPALLCVIAVGISRIVARSA